MTSIRLVKETEKQQHKREGSPRSMDPFLVMLGCLTCTMTALIFVEVRRIRKRLEQRAPEATVAKTAA
jgi:hypothetical protein